MGVDETVTAQESFKGLQTLHMPQTNLYGMSYF
jgi:hypothetical protein